MTYRVEVTASTINELSGKLAALASQLKGLPSTAAPIFEHTEVSVTIPAPEPEVAPAPEPEPVKIEAARTYDYATEVAPHVLGLVNKRGRDAAKAVLAQFGVLTASKLDPSRYGELVSAIDAALEEKA